MTEREIEQFVNPESECTLRIVEVSGMYPGFRVQILEAGGMQSKPYWYQLAFEDSLDAAREEVRLIQLGRIELRSLMREYVSFGANRPFTPDGAADYAHKYADGVFKYNTPGHGYMFLAEEQNQTIHPAWRNAAGFYEEDVCWAIVAHHYPDLFTTRDRRDAKRTLINYMPHEYMAVTGETLSVDDSMRLQEETFAAATHDKWVTTSARASGSDMVEVTAVLGRERRSLNRKERRFLISTAEYDARAKFGFIVDPETHWEVGKSRPHVVAA